MRVWSNLPAAAILGRIKKFNLLLTWKLICLWNRLFKVVPAEVGKQRTRPSDPTFFFFFKRIQFSEFIVEA